MSSSAQPEGRMVNRSISDGNYRSRENRPSSTDDQDCAGLMRFRRARSESLSSLTKAGSVAQREVAVSSR